MFCGKCSLTIRCPFLPLNEISSFVTTRHFSTTLNVQMKKLIDSKRYRHALDIFDKQSHAADDFALNMALKACSNLPDYRRGLEIVRQLSPKSLNNPFIQTSLVHFYMKSGDLKCAIGLFNSIPVKTNPLYKTLFGGLISMKKSKEVLNLYEQNKMKLDEGVFVMVSKACSEICDDRAKRIGKLLIDDLPEDLKGSEKVMNSTIFMLMKFGNVDEAEKLFHQMKHKSIYTYGAMMKGYNDNKLLEKTLDLFETLPFVADEAIYAMVLSSCSQVRDGRARRIGKRLIDNLPEDLKDSENVMNSTIFMLMNFGNVDEAEKLFRQMKHKSIYTYGAMMKGYNDNKKFEKTLDLFETLPFVANQAIYAMVLSSCSQLTNDRARRIGKQLIDNLPEDLKGSEKVMNSTIFMLMKFGNVDEAEKLFHQMKYKSIYTYGAMMKGYHDNEMFEKVLDFTCTRLSNDRALQTGKELLRKMNKSYYNNNIVITSAIHMLMKFDLVNDAERLFRQVKTKSALTYHAMINGYSQLDELDKCFQLFDQMKSDQIVPNEVVFLSMIGVCAKIAIRSVSQSVANQLPSHMKSSRNIQTALISMWGKSSSIEKSREVFESLDDPDMVTYSSMINAYGLNGMGVEAVELYRRIPSDLCNEVVNVCALNACSHAGLLNECRHIFDQIPHKTTKIVTTMVDCLSRLAMFDEAESIIEDYEKTNPPSSAMYTALLSGARNVRDSNLSNRIYKKMQQLFPDEKNTLIAGSVLLSNIYSSIGDHHRAEDIRTNRIKQFGYNVKVGLSWTSVNNQLVRFKAHDHSHPQSKEIYEELQRLSCELREHGHIFDSSWITRPVKEDETVESVLCGHSEKLAIAFNFIQQPPPSIIQISKNLRVCGDCHAATKLITKMRRCEIIIRDANRIHHFSNGECSCQDHF
ncbi:unnamed protein product [Adineta ricciae]|uniref:DYW domain-containing protein n=1 Tax=Adineta ricciae TaxID=249248 RepID=A0A814XSC7_ADIRI|nr:unnamed protein product [Adineta ricciae]